jgi:hypothetical protein
MMNRSAEGDAAAEMLERRWFAAQSAVTATHADCEALREALELAESAWREARTRLAQLQVLRDVLDEELSTLHGGALTLAQPRAASRP